MPLFVPVHPPKNPDECQSWLYEAITRLNRAATSSAQGAAAIIRGEAPDGSGNPLVDTSKFFYKPGLSGGQLAYGGINTGEALTLSSTAASSKGLIYLGSAKTTAYDEVNDRIGIGTTTPAAKLETNTAAIGTSTIGAIGNVMIRMSIAGSVFADIVPYLFDNTPTYDIAFKPAVGNGAGLQIIPVDGTSGLRFAAGSSRGFIQAGRKDSSNFVQESALTIGGQGATVLQQLSTEAQYLALTITGTTGQNNTVITVRTARVGINTNPFDYSSTANASRAGSFHIAQTTGAISTDPAPLTIENSLAISAAPMLDIRQTASGGASPSKTLGNLGFRLTSDGDLLWYNSGNRRSRLQAQTSSTGSGGFNFLNSSDRTVLSGWPIVTGWSDLVASNILLSGNNTDDSSRTILTGDGGIKLNRFGILAAAVVIGNRAGIGTLPAPAANRILTLDNGTSSVAFDISAATSARTVTFPNYSGTLAFIDFAQTFTAAQTFDTSGTGLGVAILIGNAGGDEVLRFADVAAPGTNYLSVVTGGVISGVNTLTLPPSGTLVTTSASATLLNKSIQSGSHTDTTDQTGDVAASSITISPSSTYVYVVEVLAMCTVSDAAAGAITVTIGYTDTIGATTTAVVADPSSPQTFPLSLAAQGRAFGRVVVRRASGNITYAVTHTGSYGTAKYRIYARILALGA